MAVRAQMVSPVSASLPSASLRRRHVTGHTRVHARPMAVQLANKASVSRKGPPATVFTTSLSNDLKSFRQVASVLTPLKTNKLREGFSSRPCICAATSAVPFSQVYSGDKEVAKGDRRSSGGKQTKHRLVMMRHSSSVSVAPGVKVIFHAMFMLSVTSLSIIKCWATHGSL